MNGIVFLDANALIALVVAFAPLCSKAAEPLSGMAPIASRARFAL